MLSSRIVSPVYRAPVVYSPPPAYYAPGVTYQRVETTTTYQSPPYPGYPPVVYESQTCYGY